MDSGSEKGAKRLPDTSRWSAGFIRHNTGSLLYIRIYPLPPANHRSLCGMNAALQANSSTPIAKGWTLPGLDPLLATIWEKRLSQNWGAF